jgi:hypothetical protein
MSIRFKIKASMSSLNLIDIVVCVVFALYSSISIIKLDFIYKFWAAEFRNQERGLPHPHNLQNLLQKTSGLSLSSFLNEVDSTQPNLRVY